MDGRRRAAVVNRYGAEQNPAYRPTRPPHFHARVTISRAPLSLPLRSVTFGEDVGARRQDAAMSEVFVGSRALADGTLAWHELRRWYRPIFRDVYIPKSEAVTLRDRTVGAWMATQSQSVIAGVAASALHGANWVDADTPIELISRQLRPQLGLVVRRERLADDEITCIAGLPVTTRVRTAFDLGRHLPRGDALVRMDALMRSMLFSTEDVLLLAKRYQGARGIRQLRELLPLVDGGAASPQESLLRLAFLDAGLPRPVSQFPIVDCRGMIVRIVDMAWEDFMVAAEYDGEQHQRSRYQYRKDAWVLPMLARMGWIVVRAFKEDRRVDVAAEARAALISRGWKP